jgi:hypothetical protein
MTLVQHPLLRHLPPEAVTPLLAHYPLPLMMHCSSHQWTGLSLLRSLRPLHQFPSPIFDAIITETCSQPKLTQMLQSSG